MAYDSKYTGAQIDAALDKANKLPATTGTDGQCLGVSNGVLGWITPLTSVSASQVTAGTFPGVVVANNNTSYSTKQVRNIFFETREPTSADGSNGDIWIMYDDGV